MALPALCEGARARRPHATATEREDARPLFVGLAPSPTTQRFGGHPLVGETGARLAEWSGTTMARFHRDVECVNVLERLPDGGLWRVRDLRAAAAARVLPLMRDREVVLLGEQVRLAVGLIAETRALGWVDLPADAPVAPGCDVLYIPHPSGLNRFWNDAANRRRVTCLLHELFGRKVPGDPARLWS